MSTRAENQLRKTIASYREKKIECFKLHEKAMNELYDSGLESFAIKIPFSVNSTEMVAFFESEFKGDYYIELVSKTYDTLKDRQLYKWNYNQYWQSEYERIEGSNDMPPRYLVPVHELVKVSSTIPEVDNFDESFDEFQFSKEDNAIATPLAIRTSKPFVKNVSSDDEDMLFSQATLRDVYAVLHNKPVSKKDWINKMITNG
jgi:hypothetical protein